MRENENEQRVAGAAGTSPETTAPAELPTRGQHERGLRLNAHDNLWIDLWGEDGLRIIAPTWEPSAVTIVYGRTRITLRQLRGGEANAPKPSPRPAPQPERDCWKCGCLASAHRGPRIGCEGAGGNCGCSLTAEEAAQPERGGESAMICPVCEAGTMITTGECGNPACREGQRGRDTSPEVPALRWESAWVIEMQPAGAAPFWWGPSATDQWTRDVNAAVRFARREDAQRVIDARHFRGKAIEHAWTKEPT